MVINIFGKRGSGKTTMIRGSLGQFPGPVAIIDVLGNFGDSVPEENLTDSVEEFLSMLKLWVLSADKQKARRKAFVLQPRNPSLAVDFVSAALWELEGGTLVLDETDAVDFTQAPCFDDLVRYGRNRRVHLVTGCRRPFEIPRNITAAANRLFLLQTQEPRDVEYFSQTLIGERAETLMAMPRYHGIFVNYDDSQISNFSFNQKGEITLLDVESLR